MYSLSLRLSCSSRPCSDRSKLFLILYSVSPWHHYCSPCPYDVCNTSVSMLYQRAMDVNNKVLMWSYFKCLLCLLLSFVSVTQWLVPLILVCVSIWPLDGAIFPHFSFGYTRFKGFTDLWFWKFTCCRAGNFCGTLGLHYCWWIGKLQHKDLEGKWLKTVSTLFTWFDFSSLNSLNSLWLLSNVLLFHLTFIYPGSLINDVFIHSFYARKVIPYIKRKLWWKQAV
jgi:hypothetical protein